MFRIFSRVQLAYLAVFLLICAGLYVYEAMYVWPAQRCEADGAWWNARDRECDTPIQIWRITGKAPRARAAPPSAAPRP
ncbi:MAG: hypothetical protein JO127_05495 [Caulobacteraceae bacterium]|nr:hypothetical protein [Caulobacteraceae bacterium]